MKYKDITHKNLNNGKKTRIYYTVHEKEFEVFFREIYEEEHYAAGLRIINKDSVVVDLGANVGLATLYFAPYVKKVYAFEPSPPVFEALKKNTKHLTNVEIFNEGVSSYNHKMIMGSASKDSLPQQIWYDNTQPVNSLMADFYDIKTLFERHNIGHVDLLKVDIESSEHEVFPSDEFGEVSKQIDAIIGEGHIIKGDGGISLRSTPAVIPVMLEEWGYKAEFIKSPKPYFEWIQTYTSYYTGKVKEYRVPIDAIFFAQKK